MPEPARYWSVQRARAYGMGDVGFLPIVAAVVGTGAQLYQQKREKDKAEKEAERAAQAARDAARRQKAFSKNSPMKWVIIGGGALVAAGVIWAVMRKRGAK